MVPIDGEGIDGSLSMCVKSGSDTYLSDHAVDSSRDLLSVIPGDPLGVEW